MQDILALLESCMPVRVGNIPIRNQTLLIGDPFFISQEERVPIAVEDGRYPVILFRREISTWGMRNIAACVRLDDTAVIRDLAPVFSIGGQPHSYSSDTGLGSYMDDYSFVVFSEEKAEYSRNHLSSNFYSDVLATEFRTNAERPDDVWDAGAWALHTITGAKEAAVAMFSSGLGDGIFKSYFGYDGLSRLVALVTDFHVLASTGFDLKEVLRFNEITGDGS